MKIHYHPRGHYFGDCMPFYNDGKFYLYHQRDTRKPGPFGEPFGWSLATTVDFVDYKDEGEPIPGGGDHSNDQFIFAGSVYEGVDHRFHAIYTGYNRDRIGTGVPSQVLLEAVSDDLLGWSKDGVFELAPPDGFDKEDWRDPFVLWDPSREQWMMILGARLESPKTCLTGRTVWFSSPDQKRWKFEGDLWAPGLYTMHEMPDLFEMDGRWYLLTTEYSDKSKTVYCVGESATGPWHRPEDDAFDGRAYYAARSVTDGVRRFLVGWVATKEGGDSLAPFEWGGTLEILEIVPRADGTLGVRPPTEVWDAVMADSVELPGQSVERIDGRACKSLVDVKGESYGFEVLVRIEPGTRSFSILFGGDAEVDDWYSFEVNLHDRQLTFDRVPNFPWNRYDNKGLNRPLPADLAEHDVRVRLVVDESVATIFVDDIALSARVYDLAGNVLGVSVVDGRIDVIDPRLGAIG